MSYLLEITKDTSINKTLYAKGEKVYVSKSIMDLKIEEGVAKLVVEKQKQEDKLEDKE